MPAGHTRPVAAPLGLGSNNDMRVNGTMWCAVEGTCGTGLGTVRRPPYTEFMRIWLDLPDALGDRVAAPGQDLSEAAFHALVIDAYRMGRLTEHELREVLDLPTRDALDGFLKAHGVPLDYSVEDLADERALAARLWPDTASR